MFHDAYNEASGEALRNASQEPTATRFSARRPAACACARRTVKISPASFQSLLVPVSFTVPRPAAFASARIAAFGRARLPACLCFAPRSARVRAPNASTMRTKPALPVVMPRSFCPEVLVCVRLDCLWVCTPW